MKTTTGIATWVIASLLNLTSLFTQESIPENSIELSHKLKGFAPSFPGGFNYFSGLLEKGGFWRLSLTGSSLAVSGNVQSMNGVWEEGRHSVAQFLSSLL